MLRDDGCGAVFDLLRDPGTHPEVRVRCRSIVDTMNEHGFVSEV